MDPEFLIMGWLMGKRMAGQKRIAGRRVELPSYPTMAARKTWYKGTALRETVTEIHFVKSYSVTGNEIESWAADVDDSGSIMCYLNGTILTICSMGADRIMMNEDSRWMFFGNTTETAFKALTSFYGFEMLDTSKTTDMYAMFRNCEALQTLDVSHFDTRNVTTMVYMFASCKAIQTLDLSNFDTRNVTEMAYMFQSSSAITAIYVGDGWTTENANTTNMFNDCGVSSVTRV